MLSVYIFWIGLAVVFYTYVGYAFFVVVLAAARGRRSNPDDLSDDQLPRVTLVIAAFNEEKILHEKIRNTLALDYPGDKLEIFFVTDGSSDHSPEIIRSYSGLRLFHETGRKGKIHAVNRVMKYVTSPVTVFCDANTFLNAKAIRRMVRHYTDQTIGGVAGEKRIFKKESDNAAGSGEGVYWKYESLLKQKDYELYSVVGAAGELFSIRTELFEAPAEDMIIEDFFLSMTITAKGFRFAYEPGSYAVETASASVDEEWKRKVRICAGAFQAMARLGYLLNPFRYGILSFQYFSHRVLRWTFAPLSLPLIFFSNVVLAGKGNLFFDLTMTVQVLFYMAALSGYLLRDKKVALKAFFVPYYFVVMNAAVYAGFYRFVRGEQNVIWEQAKRAEMEIKQQTNRPRS